MAPPWGPSGFLIANSLGFPQNPAFTGCLEAAGYSDLAMRLQWGNPNGAPMGLQWGNGLQWGSNREMGLQMGLQWGPKWGSKWGSNGAPI